MRQLIWGMSVVAAVMLCSANGYAAEDAALDAEILNFEEPQTEQQPAAEQTATEENNTVAEQTETTDTENEAEAEEKPEEVEEELVLDVFSPEFMASLRICREDSATNGQRVFEIKGLRDGKCYLTYGNYILNVPTNVLNNIHSFDDLQTLLKNKDMVRYKYLPEYTYEGLIYALDACAHKQKYYGVEIEERKVDAVITRGLIAEYQGDYCEIVLQNELELDEDLRDYGVTCRLTPEVIDELEPYFTDIVAKYKDIKATELHQIKEVRDADLALMYYLQQNEYCRKNNVLLK